MKRKWLALLAVMLTYSFAFLTRYIYSPMMMDMSDSLGLNSAKAGLLMTGFMVGYIAMQLPGGLLADRMTVKYILITDMLIGGMGTVMLSAVTSFTSALLLRLLIGLSCGSVYSCCSKIVSHYFRERELSIAMGILLATGPLGIMLANSLGEIINRTYGWRKTFLITSTVSALSILCLIIFTEPFKAEKHSTSVEGLISGIKEYIKDRQQLILGMSGFMLMFETVGFAHWTNVYLEESVGLSGDKAGMILTVYSIAGIIFSSLSGFIARKLDIGPRKFIIYTEIMMLVTTVGFALSRNMTIMIVMAILCGAFTYLPSTHYVTLALSRCRKENIGTTAAFQNLIFQFGGLVQSALIGILIDAAHSYAPIWIAFTISCVLEIMFIVLFREKTA